MTNELLMRPLLSADLNQNSIRQPLNIRYYFNLPAETVAKLSKLVRTKIRGSSH